MPRKTKEQNELENETKVKSLTKGSTKSTKTTSSKKANTKSTTAKEETTKKETVKSNSKKSVAKSSTKKSATSKKNTTTKKVSANKKTTPKKARSISSKKTKSNKIIDKKIEVVEYYDLPYRYNQTIVKVLYQTPKTLFIYWDISDDDKKAFEKQYGEDFFQTTRPILIVHNDTLGYNFEVEINDFANSWYLHVSDSKCEYRIELGRRPIHKTEKIDTDYIYISMSNEIESPNDHILFNKDQKMVYFRNVKTGAYSKKSITSISFIRNMGKIYNIYDLYKALYADENVEEIYDLSNPSSRKYFIIRIQIKCTNKQRRIYNERKKRICKFRSSCTSTFYTSS